ncbi:hypothetical protein EVAR_100152_1 [Eumeta japonica]|uniref:Uncharacterized protein n=1 Tax=Eumeta variegata TaxID=151549 RepID=A0A4C1ZX42_EUMVA|nr:hypothetical protein EVAR_100152_1 [Eumeta japonica]
MVRSGLRPLYSTAVYGSINGLCMPWRLDSMLYIIFLIYLKYIQIEGEREIVSEREREGERVREIVRERERESTFVLESNTIGPANRGYVLGTCLQRMREDTHSGPSRTSYGPPAAPERSLLRAGHPNDLTHRSQDVPKLILQTASFVNVL